MEGFAKLFVDAVGGALDKLINPITVGTALLFCGGALLLPSQALEALSLSDLVATNRHYLGAGFLLCSCYFVVLLARWMIAKASAARERRLKAAEVQAEAAQRDRARIDLVARLTKEELQRVRPFIVEDAASVNYSAEDGPAAMLRAANVLAVHVKTYDVLTGLPHSITPWAKELLMARRDELKALEPYKRPRLW